MSSTCHLQNGARKLVGGKQSANVVQGLHAERKELIEPIFGILKEQLGAGRFLLGGLAKLPF